jgi:hypothetical protein
VSFWLPSASVGRVSGLVKNRHGTAHYWLFRVQTLPPGGRLQQWNVRRDRLPQGEVAWPSSLCRAPTPYATLSAKLRVRRNGSAEQIRSRAARSSLSKILGFQPKPPGADFMQTVRKLDERPDFVAQTPSFHEFLRPEGLQAPKFEAGRWVARQSVGVFARSA